ncbi:MAG: HEAT repeat domain-containing protein [Pyrinomonadaceae bacterium]
MSLVHYRHSRVWLALYSIFVVGVLLISARISAGQSNQHLTPAQVEIEKQRQRLSSADEEERRDAVMKLMAMHLPAAAQASGLALTDASPKVRAVAAKAALGLGTEESVSALIPLANDKDEFVRREVMYALGFTHSRNATQPLVQHLMNDKEPGVRGAAAVALGELVDAAAVVPLANTLAPNLSAPAKGEKRPKRETNPFVLRAVAIALGRIRSRAGTPALIATVTNDKLDSDIRREAARALGTIGDQTATAALQTVVTASDPYLSRIAQESLRKLNP